MSIVEIADVTAEYRLGTSRSAAHPPLRIAIVVHLYYHHLWPEFAAHVRHVPEPFALYVTIPEESPAEPAILSDFPDAIVRRVPNVGRDVAPFLALLPELQAFDLVCKIHTKRDTPRNREWRIECLVGLLGSRAEVTDTIAAFAARPKLMMAGPRDLWIDGPLHIANVGPMLEHFESRVPERYRFFAGTMFWCRPSLFADFPVTFPQSLFVRHGEPDGHVEHAIERLFGVRASDPDLEVGLTSEGGAMEVLEHTATAVLPTETVLSILNRKVVPRHSGKAIDWYSDGRPAAAAISLPSMRDLYAAHQGLVSDKWDSYLTQYERLFGPYRQRNVSILEIGVQNGGSLEIMARYFPHASAIIGCDINPACAALRFADPRIHLFVGDAGTRETRQQIILQSPRLDIVIEDGSHRSGDIVQAFANYFPAIADGGMFIAEDLHCSYWASHDGGLYHPHSSIAFFKALADVVNHAHWGTANSARSRLDAFSKAYGVNLRDKTLAHIHAVEFTDSICVVHKRAPEQNGLGRRHIVGQTALVEPAVFNQSGRRLPPRSQRRNPYRRPPKYAAQTREPLLVRIARRLDRALKPLKNTLRPLRKLLPRR